ncbi:MAG: efflux RND transporter periplasmic adaptor subunit [Sedimentitalea sp.]
MRLALTLIAALLPLPVAAQSVSAILEPGAFTEIRTTVTGRIAQIVVQEGAIVREGDLLATIDSRVQQARVELAEIVAASTAATERADIAIRQAADLRKRVASARAKGAAQKWEVTQSELAVELAEADRNVTLESIARNQSQLALERATLSEFSMVAPYAGTVLQIHVDPGAIVEPETTVMDVAKLDHLIATAFVPVDWLADLDVGARLSARIARGGSVVATVRSIDPRIDPASLSVRVTLEIDNRDGLLLAGSAIEIDQP